MFGNIVLCEFPFTSGASSKVRPALVLFDLASDAIICRVTSVLHADPRTVQLVDWRAAGLLKASVARLDRIITAEKSIFIRTLGTLTTRDLDSVRLVWNRHMTL